MQGKDTRRTAIVGGTYTEMVFDAPQGKQLWGSGYRAFKLFHTLGWDTSLTFHTACSKAKSVAIRQTFREEDTYDFVFQEAADVHFYYEHPFRVSEIYPRPDVLFKNKQTLQAEADDILLFGMIDADFHVQGKRVVYDPQTQVLPQSFRQSGSHAEELVLILNRHEAKVISGKDELEGIRDYFFQKELCCTLIVKCGVEGAFVFTSAKDEAHRIPVYHTETVHSIGSGDVFTAYFAYRWFRGADILTAAGDASKAVACYSATNQLETVLEIGRQTNHFVPIAPCGQRQVYLAGPFFTYAQRWLVNEFYHALQQEGCRVFSPFHDVGIGDAATVTKPDLKGLDDSSVVLAIVDGLDTGTIFEVGYAVARGKRVVAYVEHEHRSTLQMLEGTGCEFVTDFTTAVYKTCWHAMQ